MLRHDICSNRPHLSYARLRVSNSGPTHLIVAHQLTSRRLAQIVQFYLPGGANLRQRLIHMPTRRTMTTDRRHVGPVRITGR